MVSRMVPEAMSQTLRHLLHTTRHYTSSLLSILRKEASASKQAVASEHPTERCARRCRREPPRKMCPCQARFTIFRVLNTVCSRSKHSQDHGRRLNHICQPNTPRRLIPICHVNPTPSSTTTKRACERTKTSVRHGWKNHFGLQCSRLKVAATTKIVVAGEKPDPCATSHHRHDAGAPSILHRA